MGKFAVGEGASWLTVEQLADGAPIASGWAFWFGVLAGGSSHSVVAGPRPLFLEPHSMEVTHFSAPAESHLRLQPSVLAVVQVH